MSVADRYLRTLENHDDSKNSAPNSPKKLKSPAKLAASPVKQAISPKKLSPTRASPTKTVATPIRGSPQRSPMRTSLPVITPTQNKERKKLLISENSASVDQERRNLQAYEYLCHVGEAHEWMSSILGADQLPPVVVDLPEKLVDGVLLAKIARHFKPDLVPKIFEHPRLQYRHTDNIRYFFNFLSSVNMPELFKFDSVDLYEKRNLPKVIFCIHALSHVLNEIDLAPEMGDLVGKLNFTDDQLNNAQKGLEAAGMTGRNFNKVTRHFSGGKDKRPPPQPVFEEESVAEPTSIARSITPEPVVTPPRKQSYQVEEIPSIHISEEELLLIELESHETSITRFQAICRGHLLRRAHGRNPATQEQTYEFVSHLQACIRAAAVRQRLNTATKSVDHESLAQLQAVIRGNKSRSSYDRTLISLSGCETSIVAIQSMIRAHSARNHRKPLQHGHDTLPRFQAACRGVIARRKVAAIDRHLELSSSLILQLQKASRAHLARQKFYSHRTQICDHNDNWTSLQAIIRGKLCRSTIQKQREDLKAAESSIIGVQSAFRGLLSRFRIGCIFDDIDDRFVEIVHLQLMCRGYLVRKAVNASVKHWQDNVDTIVKVQSRWRTKTHISAYNSLIADPNPSLSTIMHFVHLLNDNEADYQEEINLEIARKQLKDQVRSNEQLEQYIDQMDTKIALLVKNKISLDEVIQHRNSGAPGLLRRNSSARLRQQQQQSIDKINASSGKTLDLKALNKNSRKRLELYQGLFYILQTQPQYLPRYIAHMDDSSRNASERDLKKVSDFIFTIFGGLSEDREEYFFLQLLSKTIYTEMNAAEYPVIEGSALVWRLFSTMNKRRSVQKALQSTMSSAARRITSASAADLESDPLAIYHFFKNQDEMNGITNYYEEVTVEMAIKEPRTRSKFVSNLQLLRELVLEVIDSIEHGIEKMPYHARFLAHQAYMHSCRKYDNVVGYNPISVVGTIFIDHFIAPAMVASDSYGITDTALDMYQIKNLNLVVKVLGVAAQFSLFEDDEPYLQPLNEFVKSCSERFGVIFKKLIDIPDLQTTFGMTNFDDMKNHSRPTLSIKTEEILSVHSLVFENMDVIADSNDNCIRPVLRQLGPLPNDARDILDIARFTQVRLDLNPNYGTPTMQADNIDTAGLMTLVKRCLIYVLRVQKGENLMQVLVEPVEEQQEMLYARILQDDQSSIGAKKPGELANLTYRELKLLTLEKVLELESSGRVSRDNHYQELINSLANDIRNKHELRQARVSELTTCNETLQSLQEKETYLKTTHKTYNNYIETAMTTLQEQSQEKNRKKSVFPFGRKFFMQRDLLKSGKKAKFGSYRYTASQALEKGILQHVKGYSERQYRDLTVTFSCDTISNFNIEIAYKGIILPNAISTITLDQLLGYQYEDKEYFDLFDDVVRFHTTRLLNFIFRKFYGVD